MSEKIKDIIEIMDKRYTELNNFAKDCAENFIKDKNYNELKILDNNKAKEDITLVKIKKYDDLEKLIKGTGFYLILSDYNYEINKCKFKIKPENTEVKVIYRGHCTKLRNRIQSHLYNKKHNEEISKSIKYEVCMKLEKNNNGTYKQGINIDDNIYENNVFYVIQYKMSNSKKFMRESMEKAFDNIYEKPIACRDK